MIFEVLVALPSVLPCSMYGGQTDEDRERTGVSSIIATRLFESRMKQMETVGRRALPKIRRKPKPGLQSKAVDLAGNAGLDTDSSAFNKNATPAAEEIRVIDPWWLNAENYSAEGSRKSLSMSLSPRDRAGSHRSLDREDGKAQAMLLPRPALPKLPNAASAACWPAGQARWRWRVPCEDPESPETAREAPKEVFSARSDSRPHGRPWWELHDDSSSPAPKQQVSNDDS